MAGLVQKRWVQEASGFAVAAVLLVVVVVLLASGEGGSTGNSVGDRVFLTSGGTIQQSGHMPGVLGKLRSQITVDMDLPLTAAEAVADGWTDPIFCSVGRGRYFQKGPAGEGEPFFLMYNGDDELIGMYQFSKSEMPTDDELLGMYLFSKSEMPSPWHRWDELKGGGGLTLIDFEHWSLVVFTQDATRACGAGLSATKRGQD
jgi:hypothetical protein